MVKEFKLYLKESDLSRNTVESYVWTVNNFISKYGAFTKEKLLAYKGFLMEHFKPQTINLRLQAINKYLEFIHKSDLKLKFVKVQQKNFLENVISDADYRFLKRKLKSNGQTEWYFIVWFMGATGARISELLKIKAEHVEVGYLDIYS
jgi:integrase